MRPRTLRRRLVLAGFGAIITGALLGTGVAKADTNDDGFIITLDNQGITYPNYSYVIHAGHGVCSLRELGYTEMQTAAIVQSNSGLTAYNAGFFVGVSEGAYCPWYYMGGTQRA